MKKIGNFSQTYQFLPEFTEGSDGRDREYLIDFLLKDDIQIWLRSNLDLHTFSFHNYNIDSARSIISRIKERIPNTRGLCYNNMTYGLSFLKHLEFLQSRGITDVMWIQDDEFTTHTNLDDYKDFLEFYKSRPDINHVSLSVHKERLSQGINGPSNDDIGEKINDNLTIYKTNCNDFFNFDRHAFPSGAVICDIGILLNVFRSMPSITTTTNAYHVEDIMCHTGLMHNFQRCVLNVPLLGVYNITGMGGSLGHAEFYLDELNKKFITSVRLDDLWK